MNRSRALGIVALITVGLTAVGLARVRSPLQSILEETIGGTISATRVITHDAKLTGDVTCTVQGMPCLQLNASSIKLDLNGFTITGLGDPSTGCQSSRVVGEEGIAVTNQHDVTIQGPGLVQRFRADGILISNSNRAGVVHVTTSTNCMSGILLGASSDGHVEGNVSVRNGNTAVPCGGL